MRINTKARRHEGTKARRGREGTPTSAGGLVPFLASRTVIGSSQTNNRDPSSLRAFVPPCLRAFFSAICLLFTVSPALAAPIHSNASGGGAWSDPETWHGEAVPGPEDTVIIATRDVVIFDRDDADRITCRKILIDPEGVLTFKRGAGRFTLTVNGSVESYGAIKINGTKSPDSHYELRLLTDPSEERGINLLRDSALLVYGYKGFQRRRRNVRITAAAAAVSPADQRRPAWITADQDVMIDLDHTSLSDVVVQASSLDNTGAEGNERLNLIRNLLTGLARLEISKCDTPTIRGNFFDAGDVKVDHPALSVRVCKLAEIKGNFVNGGYRVGISVWEGDTSSSAVENVVKNCQRGIEWEGTDAMVDGNLVSECAQGFVVHRSTGVLENVVVEKAQQAFISSHTDMQMTSCRAEQILEGGHGLHVSDISLSLLNCNFRFDQFDLNPADNQREWAHTMQYLVVRLEGHVRPGTQVHVQTAEVSGGPPEGKADLNVRNSPAKVDRRGLTPLPASKKPLIVRSWSIPANRQKMNAPFYEIRVVAPPAVPGEPPELVATKIVEPDESWYRLDPNRPVPTVEIAVP